MSFRGDIIGLCVLSSGQTPLYLEICLFRILNICILLQKVMLAFTPTLLLLAVILN